VANLTLIQIMQQERSFLRRVKFWDMDLRDLSPFSTCLLFNSTCCQNQSTPN